MVDPKDIQIGDVIKLKKPHPCGSFEWEVLKIGIDFRLKCTGCTHIVLVPREKIIRKIRAVKKAEG